MENHPSPIPKWANRFLEWYCPPELLEEVQGDLYESYELHQQEVGTRKANRRFILEVLRFCNYSTLKSHLQNRRPFQIQIDMIIHNLRFIFRRLAKQKLHTSLHIVGLSMGLSVCLLIGLFINNELSFDQYHKKAAQIYRVNQVWEDNSEKLVEYGTPAPVPAALAEEIPEIESVGIAYPQSEKIIEVPGKERFKQEHILMANTGLLQMFDFKVIKGNKDLALEAPLQAILSQSTAEKFFGEAEPMGKTFLYKNEHTITVTGIMEDQPQNTHLPAKILLSYFPQERFITQNQDNWGMTFGASTYVLLKEGVQAESLHPSIRNLYDVHINNDAEDPEIGYAELQALGQIHLEPSIAGGSRWVQAINPVWLWFFGGIGLLVLILACINFINLSTAQALTRAKEVGVRKAIGADRGQLINQFLGEAFLLIGVSSIAAILIAYLSVPLVNNLLEKGIDANYIFTPVPMLSFTLFILAVGFLTGIYPAWLTARFQPALVIKSSASPSDKPSNFLRKALVVTQFTISGSLLVALLIMSQQMNYFYHKNLGFDKENVITVNMPDNSKNNVFSTNIQQLPQVEAVSFAITAPASGGNWTTIMHPTSLIDPNRKEVRIIWADEVYDDIYGLNLLAGRFTTNQDTNYVTDVAEAETPRPQIVVNERLIQEMGFGSPEEALGERFLIGYNNWKPEIVGVIADFNISSLRQAIDPLIITPFSRYHDQASIKLAAGEGLASTLKSIKGSWEENFPKDIYEFNFLDKTLERLYETENRLYSLFKVFAILAILISCLGLWGLATFAAVQRTKEIGIRKVLGASLSQLIVLLSKDFLLLVLIALFLAVPIAWYGMNKWLQNFAYSVDIHWWIFAISAIAVILIAFLTVSFQSVKAALTNPVKSLRSE